jgi:protein-S-isoprenylcysteine O-methyltransferase Ste14
VSAATLESRPTLAVRLGNFFFRYRNALFPAVLLALCFGFRPVYLRGKEHLDALLDVAGLLVALTGQALRIVTIGHVYIIRGGRNRRVYAEGLVTGGMFAHSRNPLYLGNLLIVLGLFLIHGSPWVWALGVPFFLVAYGTIVAAEEAFLLSKFGDSYEAYRQDVPRWLPRLRGLGASLGETRFNWRRVVLKEYTSTYTWTAGVVLLLAIETLAYHRYQERAGYLSALWTCLGLLPIGWLTARYLKKSRRLQEGQAL